ncbi:MAG: phosphodiester glycosidase family protein [Desulfovibrio sp.]|uniref:phosphodiester glycosidase family protein n=1 Tax=Desulfovibrio sp. TaxID=885 RepID=UPI0039E36520
MKIRNSIHTCGQRPRTARKGKPAAPLQGRVFLLTRALSTVAALLLCVAPNVSATQEIPSEQPQIVAAQTSGATGRESSAEGALDENSASVPALPPMPQTLTPAAPPGTNASNGNPPASAGGTPAPALDALNQTATVSAPGVTTPVSSSAGVDEQGKPDWRQLEAGLDFGQFRLNDSEALLTALRIDPAHFNFILCARSQDGGPLRSLNQWAEQYNLSAAINASMYLPDGVTSTGYMKQNDHFNNKRVVQRFGAFFVAGPTSPELPGAAIVDRDDPQWEQHIGQYSLVIQNYRMTSADRRILWSPGGPHYSISAVAQDGDGRILFLHCRQPVEAYAFAQQLLHLPLNIRTVMYVEGGGQAGLLVRSAHWRHELAGLSAADLLVTGDMRALLPNVLGAVRRPPPVEEIQDNEQKPSVSGQPSEEDLSSASQPQQPAP